MPGQGEGSASETLGLGGFDFHRHLFLSKVRISLSMHGICVPQTSFLTQLSDGSDCSFLFPVISYVSLKTQRFQSFIRSDSNETSKRHSHGARWEGIRDCAIVAKREDPFQEDGRVSCAPVIVKSESQSQ